MSKPSSSCDFFSVRVSPTFPSMALAVEMVVSAEMGRCERAEEKPPPPPAPRLTAFCDLKLRLRLSSERKPTLRIDDAKCCCWC